jgi:predicted dehydrogenase
MATMAKEKNVITQMGIQIHSTKEYQTTRKWIQDGVIGKVRAIHSGIGGKPWGGIVPERALTPAPEYMDWDRYLGVAEHVPWRDGDIHPGNWRKWAPFGTGILGDMGCHVFDPVYMAAGLTTPKEVTSLGPVAPGSNFFAFDCHVKYLFGATDLTAGDIEVHWRSGNISAPADLHPGITAPKSGSLIIGEKGALAIPHFGPMPNVVDATGKAIPADQLPPPATGSNHYHDWVEAVLANDQSKASAPFSYGGPMTEAVLMGVVLSNWPNKSFTWDGAACRFVGDSPEIVEANTLLLPTYRKGWSAPGITA